MRKIGRMGERFFGIWCDSVNLTANGSEVDETGWDFVVEFPSSSNVGLPRDMMPTPIECKVQVKSTDHRRKGESITLSNLERLVKAKLPAFFCFIEFDGENEPQAAYLVHVGKEIIEKTLRRIRELDSKGKGNRLNKYGMLVKYTDSDRLLETTGESLKSAIEKYIPKTLEDYILEKNNFLETLGFENGKGQFTIQMSGGDPVGDLIDLSLGLRDEVYIDKSIGHHKRFEILSENSMLSSEEAILSIKTKPEPVILRFKEHEFSHGVMLKAELYRSLFNQFLPHDYIKFRVKSTMFDLTLEPFNSGGKVKYSFDLREDKENRLSDLTSHLKVFTLLKKATNSSVLEIIDEAKKLPTIAFKINVNDEIDDWSDVCDIAEMASRVCQRFSISEEEVLVTLDELISASCSIESLHGILYADPKEVHIDFPVGSDEYEEGSKLACISSAMATIGNHTIGCFWAIVGSLSVVGKNQYRLIAENIFAGNELVSINGRMIEQSTIDKRFDDFEEELQRMGLNTIRITPSSSQHQE